MKIKTRLNRIISGFTAAIMSFTMFSGIKTINSEAAAGDKYFVDNNINQFTGESDEYTYDVWVEKECGSGSITLGNGANFMAEWSASVPNGNFIARRGLDFGDQKKATDYDYLKLEYEADFNQTDTYREIGHSSLYVSGWFQNLGLDENVPLVEYFIIEDWVDWCPDGNGKIVTIDGEQYKIFQMECTGPTINSGSETYKRYYSVRQSRRTSGRINVSEHFKAWENEGWEIGNLHDIDMCVEGWQSSGYADVELDFYSGPVALSLPDTRPEPSPEYIRGDLNNDSKINIFDLVLEKQTIINDGSRDVASPASDIDGDGQVAVNDLVLLSKYIHGKITSFPIILENVSE